MVLGSGGGVNNAPMLRNRQLSISALSTTTFLLYDMMTGDPIDGSGLNYTPSTDYMAHVKLLQLPYADTGGINGGIGTPQQQDNMWLFYPGYEPRYISIGAAITTVYQTIPYSFSLHSAGLVSTSANIYDGPYLDPPLGTSQQGNDTATLSSMTTLTPTITLSGSGSSFTTTTDVGRQIRLWSQPPAYDNTHSYSVDDTTTYNGAFYTLAIAASAGTIPGQTIISGGVTVLPWVPSPRSGLWRYGVITAVTNSSVAVLKLQVAFTAVQKNGTGIDTYQFGLFTDTGPVWPTQGCVHKGRLYMFGAVENRFDASAANAFSYNTPENVAYVLNNLTTNTTPTFSPTNQYGNVGDGNGISLTLNAPSRQQILQMVPEHDGLIALTLDGEWLISAPGQGAISPTNIEANPISSIGSIPPALPVRVSSALLFPNPSGILLIEYIADVFKAGKYVGRPINVDAKHMTGIYGLNPGGIKQLAYLDGAFPGIWAVVWSGDLISCSYRRNGTYASQNPDLYAWHTHDHGTGRLFTDLCVGASGAPGGVTGANGTFGNQRALLTVTKNSDTQLCYVEMMHTLFRETDLLPTAFQVDGPCCVGVISGTDNPTAPPAGCSVFGAGASQGADVLLTNHNLTAQGGNVGSAEIAQGCQITPGYFYFEFTFDSGTASHADGVGISLPAATAANIDNSWTNGAGINTSSATKVNGGSAGSGTAMTTSTVVSVAVDTVHGQWYTDYQTAAGGLPFDTNPPSATSFNTVWGTTGGAADITAQFTNVNACLTALFKANTADSFTINNGPTFYRKRPMGLSTGWNGRNYAQYAGFDSATGVTITYHGVGNDYYGFGGVAARGKTSKAASSGKYYIEFLASQVSGGEVFGICDATYIVGATTGTHYVGTGVTNNAVGEIALDTTAKLLWYRTSHAAGWAPSGDPALGTGGASLAALTFPVYFAARSTAGAAFLVITDPNCMKNSPPSGFTAGWT